MADERELVDRAATGDAAAQKQLFDRHLPAVWRLALRLTQRRDVAEECTQIAFVKAFRDLADFRGESSFATWIYRIAYRAAVDVLRQEARHDRTRAGLALLRSVPPSEPDPFLQHRILQALDELDGIHREVFLLFHLAGSSHAEIAELLGIPEGTSKRRLFVARRRLRAALEETER